MTKITSIKFAAAQEFYGSKKKKKKHDFHLQNYHWKSLCYKKKIGCLFWNLVQYISPFEVEENGGSSQEVSWKASKVWTWKPTSILAYNHENNFKIKQMKFSYKSKLHWKGEYTSFTKQ